MAKSISTLVEDIYSVIDNKGGWDEAVSSYFSEELKLTVDSRLSDDQEGPRGTLRMSNLGAPCKRKLWYEVNRTGEGEALRPPTKLKFLYGDILEALLISLAKAAGHDVRGEQDELNIGGIKGHRDCVIDGITIDIKSASGYGFKKFQDNGLRSDDPFGYLPQLSSYVYAGHLQDETIHPTSGGFLAVNKENGEICLDLYDLTDLIGNKEEEVEKLKAMVSDEIPPNRSFAPVPDGGSGNMKLGVNCSYCSFKKLCWPEMRTFIYANGPRFLVNVERLPNVPEAS